MGGIVFTYTVMRQAIDYVSDDEHPHLRELETWDVWDVQANNAQEAVEACADIPATYLVYECEPREFEVNNFTRLRAVEAVQSDE
jgi:hypothetical protein